jgi:hypothetical protein
VLGLMIENHPHRALADFGGISVRCFAHDGSILLIHAATYTNLG